MPLNGFEVIGEEMTIGVTVYSLSDNQYPITYCQARPKGRSFHKF